MKSDEMTPKTRLVRLSAFAVALALSLGMAAAGTEGRISGQVNDIDGNALEGVQVTISAVGLDIKRSGVTSKKGKFTITLLNASRDWLIRLEKEGFQVIEEAIDPIVGGTLKPTYTMVVGQTVAPEQLAELERKGKSAKLYNEGVQTFATGNIEAAADLFRQALEEDPELGLAHLALARIHLATDDYAGALPHAEKTNELVPEEEMSQLVLFDALWGVEQHERALTLLDEMVTSGKVADKVAVRAYNAGVHGVKLSSWDVAKMRFNQALELDPNLLPAHLTLAQISINQGDYEAALRHANLFVEAQPEEARGLSVLYQANLAAGDEAAAQAAFDRLAAADPEMVAQTFFEAGVTHFNAGRNADAISAFEKVLKAKPDDPEGVYFLGRAYASNGDYTKAKDLIKRFLVLAPDHPEVSVAQAMLDGLE